MDVLESIRTSRKGKFTFHVGDSHYTKYFNSWTARDKAFLFKKWAEHAPFGFSENWINQLLIKGGVKTPKWNEPYEQVDGSKSEYEISELSDQTMKKIEEYLVQKDPKQNINAQKRRLEIKLERVSIMAEERGIEQKKIFGLALEPYTDMEALMEPLMNLTEEELVDLLVNDVFQPKEAEKNGNKQ